MEARAPSIEIRLLGPVELRLDDRDAPLGGPRQRALLALLAIRPGQVVPADALVEEIWAGEPPDGADATLRTYVSRLRRSLDGSTSIERTDRGYLLDVPVSAVDALEFERLVREGGETLGRGAARRARDRLGVALALWRGRPFGEVGAEGELGAAAERLEELRLLAIERRVEADLALDRAAEVVDELEGLVREHPFRERLWHHLMLALYRTGRQADALAAYHRARSQLDEQLGIEPGEELRTLEAAILQRSVPPPAAGDVAHNLPAPLTSFVGRSSELEAIERLLDRHRLVTLTGVGGVGKTRLALEVARRRVDDETDGTFLVDLAPIVDAAHVTSAIAAVLAVQEQPRQTPTDALSRFLASRRLLLVLDNCEHLAVAVAGLAEALLAASPGLRILATSREVLGTRGEVDFAVPPMALPSADHAAAAKESDAVQLFLARVREVQPDLREDEASLNLAVRICRDLDGLPLAMELAAARARALSLADIGRHLNDRFRFLISWRRLSTARHRTLREAMDWSYTLLPPDERDLLARVSVFAGGFTLDAAESVAAAPASTLDALQRLVEASLVTADTEAEPTRYRLLETVRQYAAEKLEGRRSEAEAALTRFWWVRGLLGEGRAVSEGAITRRGVVRTVAGARTHRAAASLAWAMGDFERARELGLQAVAVAEDVGDATEQLSALNLLGIIARSSTDMEAAAGYLQQAIDLAAATDNPELVSMYRGNLGTVFLDTKRHAEARELFLAVLEYRAGGGPSDHTAVAHLNLGQVELEAGDLAVGEAHFREALEGFASVGFKGRMANALQGLAAVEARTGRAEAAARRLGSAAALIGETGWATGDSPLERAAVEAARGDLGDETFERLFNEGLHDP